MFHFPGQTTYIKGYIPGVKAVILLHGTNSGKKLLWDQTAGRNISGTVDKDVPIPCAPATSTARDGSMT